ncbi:MAG: hypothetical protein EA398_18200, partial [Deltaproteobacteria bacterium]
GRALAPLHGRWPAAARDAALAELDPHGLLEDAREPWMDDGAAGDEVVPGFGEPRVIAPGLALRLASGTVDGAPGSSPPTDRLLLPTSGTTDRPAWAILEETALVAAARVASEVLALGPQESWLAVMPLYHVGGLSILTRGLCSGAATVALPRFSVEGVRRALHEGGEGRAVTGVSLVPTMLHRLLEAGVGPGTLRTALVGGAACAPALVERALAAGWPVRTTWGLTEAASQVTTMPAGRMAEAPGASGVPLPGMAVEVAEPDADGAGELVVRGPTLFRGYVGRPDRSARALRDGALWTGDIGRVRADGVVEVLDRRVDLIVSGGENVLPSRVEAVLAGVPGVAAAAVVGLPDAEWGQRVAAAVEAAPGDGRDGEALVAACAEAARRALAAHEVPRTWRVVEALPRTGSGKVRRAAVRDGWAARPEEG